MHDHLLRCVLFYFKITDKEDPARRGAERTCTPVISKAAAAPPTVSVSPSAEVWEELRSLPQNLSKNFLNLQLISGKRKIDLIYSKFYGVNICLPCQLENFASLWICTFPTIFFFPLSGIDQANPNICREIPMNV